MQRNVAGESHAAQTAQTIQEIEAAHGVLTRCMAYRFVGLLLLCLWSPALGVAQDSARVLFAEGVAFADDGQWPLAVARFRAALAEHPSSVIEFNLGLALTHTNQSLEAIEVLERVARREGVDAALHDEAATAAATERLQIAEVDVTYASSTEGLTLRVDGAPRALTALEETMRFEPGTHTITLEREDVTVARASLRLVRGTHTRYALEAVIPRAATRTEPESRQSPALPPPVEPAPRDDTNLWVGLGIGGGVLITIGAVSLGFVLASTSSPSPYGGSLGTVEINR